MIIRSETPEDVAAIAGLLDRVFGGTIESLLVSLIRASDGFVPNLSIVAEIDGVIAGHVMLSRVTIAGDADHEVLSLAPLAVDTGRQRTGIGTSLVEEALARADADGWPLVVLEGVPAYYPRFGFEPASQHGIDKPAPQVPDEAFMARTLTAYDPVIRGRLVYPPAFHEAGAIGP